MFDPNVDELFTIEQSAEVLKVDPRTIRRYIDDGSLAAYQLGPRNIRIRMKDLQELLQKITK